MKLAIEVPASTSNLGPGFDTLGMALNLCNRVRCETGGDGLTVAVRGEGADTLPADASNLVVRALDSAFDEVGQTRPPMHITIENNIPTSGGLGGSATAIVAGTMLANELLGGKLGRKDAILDRVADMEGHPDNVAPAVLGGFVTSSFDGQIVQTLRFDVPEHLVCVLAVPDLRSDTAALRAALPVSVPFADAVFNVGRTALLVGAFAQGRVDLLGRAMQDRIHEHVRTAQVPGYESVQDGAIGAGALACVLSGAGATVIAFCDERRKRQERVAEAMVAGFSSAGVSSRALAVRPRNAGATVV